MYLFFRWELPSRSSAWRPFGGFGWVQGRPNINSVQGGFGVNEGRTCYPYWQNEFLKKRTYYTNWTNEFLKRGLVVWILEIRSTSMPFFIDYFDQMQYWNPKRMLTVSWSFSIKWIHEIRSLCKPFYWLYWLKSEFLLYSITVI